MHLSDVDNMCYDVQVCASVSLDMCLSLCLHQYCIRVYVLLLYNLLCFMRLITICIYRAGLMLPLFSRNVQTSYVCASCFTRAMLGVYIKKFPLVQGLVIQTCLQMLMCHNAYLFVYDILIDIELTGCERRTDCLGDVWNNQQL